MSNPTPEALALAQEFVRRYVYAANAEEGWHVIALDLDGLLRDRKRLDWLDEYGRTLEFWAGDEAGTSGDYEEIEAVAEPQSFRRLCDAAMEAGDE